MLLKKDKQMSLYALNNLRARNRVREGFALIF
jgi:hypothetical protein